MVCFLFEILIGSGGLTALFQLLISRAVWEEVVLLGHFQGKCVGPDLTIQLLRTKLHEVVWRSILKQIIKKFFLLCTTSCL